jgi:hypothetical protein
VSATAAVAATTISAPTRRAHCANTCPTRAKLPTSPPLFARPRGGVIVLLPSYLGHRCDNRPWRGRLRSPWDRIRANVPRTAPGFDLDQGDRCPIPSAERPAQPWCAVTIG